MYQINVKDKKIQNPTKFGHVFKDGEKFHSFKKFFKKSKLSEAEMISRIKEDENLELIELDSEGEVKTQPGKQSSNKAQKAE